MSVMTSDVSQRDIRAPLTLQLVLHQAVEVADRGGIGALTMRRLAESLGVEAMSLYHHVSNKDALLDGVADLIVDEVNEAVSTHATATGPDDWKDVMKTRILTARDVMLSHKWAPSIIETRTTMLPAVLIYFHGLLEIFRAGGVSYDLAHHAMHALGSRALGFSQELFEPAPGSADEEVSAETLQQMAERLPLLVEMLSEIAHDDPEDQTMGWCDDRTEFVFALDLLLDGLERHRSR